MYPPGILDQRVEDINDYLCQFHFPADSASELRVNQSHNYLAFLNLATPNAIERLQVRFSSLRELNLTRFALAGQDNDVCSAIHIDDCADYFTSRNAWSIRMLLLSASNM